MRVYNVRDHVLRWRKRICRVCKQKSSVWWELSSVLTGSLPGWLALGRAVSESVWCWSQWRRLWVSVQTHTHVSVTRTDGEAQGKTDMTSLTHTLQYNTICWATHTHTPHSSRVDNKLMADQWPIRRSLMVSAWTFTHIRRNASPRTPSPTASSLLS